MYTLFAFLYHDRLYCLSYFFLSRAVAIAFEILNCAFSLFFTISSLIVFYLYQFVRFLSFSLSMPAAWALIREAIWIPLTSRMPSSAEQTVARSHASYVITSARLQSVLLLKETVPSLATILISFSKRGFAMYWNHLSCDISSFLLIMIKSVNQSARTLTGPKQ